MALGCHCGPTPGALPSWHWCSPGLGLPDVFSRHTTLAPCTRDWQLRKRLTPLYPAEFRETFISMEPERTRSFDVDNSGRARSKRADESEPSDNSPRSIFFDASSPLAPSANESPTILHLLKR